MYVSSILLDRFGRRTNLRLSSLSNGLNVICGPVGSGKTTLVDFLRGMWNGFDVELRGRYLPRDSRGFGGVISVHTVNGRQNISRYDDGGQEGRLTVEREDGAVIGRRSVQDLLGDVSPKLLECAFLVNFEHRPRLEELLVAAADRGYGAADTFHTSEPLKSLQQTLAEKRQRLAQLSKNRESGESPHRRKSKRSQNTVPAVAKTQQESDRATQHRQQVQELVTELEQREATVSAELTAHDLTWNELDTQRRRREVRSEDEPLPQDLSSRLRAIDTQLSRWKRTLRDIITRKQRAAERTENRQQAVAIAASSATPRRHLGALKERINKSQQVLEQIPARGGECVCQDLRGSLAEVLDAMHDDVDQLSNDLNYWQSYHLYRQAAGERDQLARCELELRQTIQSLVERRQAMVCRMVDGRSSSQESHSESGTVPDLSDARRQDAAEPSESSQADRDSGQADRDSGQADELARLNAELVRIDELRHKARRSLQEIASQLTSARADLRKLIDGSASPNSSAAVELDSQKGKEHAETDGEMRQQLLQEIGRLEAQSRRLQEQSTATNFVQQASQYLGRLSSNKWLKIYVTSPEEVLVEDGHGRRLRYHDLDGGSRDQVYLAFCLAVAAACGRDGIRIPLVLNAAFTHYPSRDVREALEVLRDFARDRQILCMTRYEHVVGLAKMLNVPVHQLSTSNTVDAHVSDSRATVVFTERLQPPVSSSAVASTEVDAEEYLIERSGRVRLQKAPPTDPVVPGSSTSSTGHAVAPASVSQSVDNSAEYHLTEYDPIENAPSIDQANANRLRRIGILRVGDLLRVPTTEIATDLRKYGITGDMVHSWQSQVRLMCRVRGLRSYDARILVACGIADPNQLVKMNPTVLRNRVREFSATAEGQAILLSGTEAELSRVTDWIQDSRPEEDGSQARGGDSNRRKKVEPEKSAAVPQPRRKPSGSATNGPSRNQRAA